MSQSQHSPVALKVSKQGSRAKGKPCSALWWGLEAQEYVQRTEAGLGRKEHSGHMLEGRPEPQQTFLVPSEHQPLALMLPPSSVFGTCLK